MHDPQGQGLSHWTPKPGPAAAPGAPAGPSLDQSILERNLRHLVGASALAVRAILDAEPRYDVAFAPTGDPVPTATIEELLGAPRLLASRRHPLEEARRWAEAINIQSNAGVVVAGFGLGYQHAALAERIGKSSVIVCFEPDLGLLRCVLERIDHSAWLARTNFVLITREDEPAIISGAISGFEAFLAAGTTIAEHPVSKARLGPVADQFGRNFASIIQAVRTNVVTTMVQMQTSMHNMCMNIERYAIGEGVEELAGIAAGRPAVVVAAGPSLERNIEELQRPGVRDRCVIIATQTTLKPLLAKGIRPHFVTALDYHEVSRRFYEGLTSADVEGVTLVVEPQANAAISDAFPGRVRSPREEVVDVLLGQDLFRPMGTLPKGATVAHLAYYLARHLGCDPVILVGQDLGFTDGQYYAAGAQIHNVWASELSGFRSLEMLEWERVKRMGGALRKARDAEGRDIYTDEQMATYLVQFERDFLGDKERGLKTLDATEGGVAKAHTVSTTLRRALETYADRPIAWPDGLVESWQRTPRDAKRLDAVKSRLRDVRRDALKLEKITIETAGVLTRILANHQDQTLVNRLIGQVEANRDKAMALKTAHWLTQFMNQSGALRRFKADRAIDIDATSDDLGKQRLQLERDLENMKALRESAELVGAVLEDSLTALGGGKKAYRPSFERDAGISVGAGPASRRVAAILIADADSAALGTPRDLATPIAGKNALRWTLEALANCSRVGEVFIATDQPQRIKDLIGPAPIGTLEVHVEATDLAPWRLQSRYRAGGRLWSRACWRGGPGGLSVYDEAIDPAIFDSIARKYTLDAAVGIGCDWALVDPSLVDAAVARYLEDTDHHKITFVHAAPGLGAMVLSAATMADLAQARPSIGIFATPAAMLGYLPVAPQFDPIARSNCVVAPGPARDAARRFIPDSAAGARAAADVLAALGAGASCEHVVPRFAAGERAFRGVENVVIELTSRRTAAMRLPWEPALPAMDISQAALERAIEQVRELAGIRPIAVTFAGRGDPLEFAGWEDAIARCRQAGAAGIHIRTQLAGPEKTAALLRAGVDLVSVDLLCFAPETYAGLTGADLWPVAKTNLDALLAARGEHAGLPSLMVVPRLTKCDLVMAELELFYDYWIMQCGAAAIDPLPTTLSGQRLGPLPIPAVARDRIQASMLGCRADGSVTRCIDDRLAGAVESGQTPAARIEPAPARTLTTA